MGKNKIIAIAGLPILLVAAVFFGWSLFSKKKSADVKTQKPISEIATTEENADTVPDQVPENISEGQPADNNVPAPADTPEKTDSGTKDETKKDSPEKPATPKSGGKIVDRLISWGFQKSSGRKIDTIILHSSYDALGDDPYSIDGIIAEFKQYGVGAHYLIGRDGTVYRLIADQNIAYHAGVSKMPDGRTEVNGFSIGIEMVNTLDGKFTSAQYDSLNRLIGDLKKKYPIKYILGHDDIAPGRKTDPWNIDWSKVQK